MTALDIKKLFNYWLSETHTSWDVAQTLFQHKKYPESLFFGHLTLEKILKALVVATTKKHAPPIHNLVRLIQLTDLKPTQEQIIDLEKWTRYCIAGRYDDEKIFFRKLCTKQYTQENFNKIGDYYLWLKNEIKKISRLQ
ncbi:MAG: HEPN domain-containing protein [Patescibacteria group bacterium]